MFIFVDCSALDERLIIDNIIEYELKQMELIASVVAKQNTIRTLQTKLEEINRLYQGASLMCRRLEENSVHNDVSQRLIMQVQRKMGEFKAKESGLQRQITLEENKLSEMQTSMYKVTIDISKEKLKLQFVRANRRQ